jgi:hypothetical protein
VPRIPHLDPQLAGPPTPTPSTRPRVA